MRFPKTFPAWALRVIVTSFQRITRRTTVFTAASLAPNMSTIWGRYSPCLAVKRPLGPCKRRSATAPSPASPNPTASSPPVLTAPLHLAKQRRPVHAHPFRRGSGGQLQVGLRFQRIRPLHRGLHVHLRQRGGSPWRSGQSQRQRPACRHAQRIPTGGAVSPSPLQRLLGARTRHWLAFLLLRAGQTASIIGLRGE